MLVTGGHNPTQVAEMSVKQTEIVEVNTKVEEETHTIPPANTEVELVANSKMDSEVQTATLRTEKVILSRGGSPFKHKDERETINDYVRDISKQYNMDPTLIMSVIQQESEYNPKAKNGNCLGLMQVSARWHKDRADRLGVTDFYDAYSNVLLGVDYLSELRDKYKDMRLVLMLYNMEHDTAVRLYKSGQISNYAKTIIARAEQYKKGE
jgi:soluble lytic murein transglycosylase-like protein